MLENLQPQSVFHYFEEICQIPHGSYHVDEISDYLMEFAKKHNLEAYQDEEKNVIMIKEASEAKKDKPAIMIQGHMDMVAVKNPGATIDLEKDPLDLAIDGDYVYAKETSLGGDDGIAVAYGLALLADDNLELPRIELVITTQEEVGMEGATAIDLTPCKAMTMLNLDSEEEGEFIVSCAGGIRVATTIPMESVELADASSYEAFEVECQNFTGGHSGVEIIYGRANAIKVLNSFLICAKMSVGAKIAKVSGGLKDNAIPVSAKALIYVKKDSVEELIEAAETFNETINEEFGSTDPNGNLVIKKADIISSTLTSDSTSDSNSESDSGSVFVYSDDSERNLITYISECPNGVQSMSESLEGLVQTSLNLGILEGSDSMVKATFALRSSVGDEKEALIKQMVSIGNKHHGSSELAGDYPAWEFKKDSLLREHLLSVYKKQYGKEGKVVALHAGLECGILYSKKPGLDCVSFGPDILDIHTTRERLSISSTKRVWDFLLEVLDTM